MSRAQQIIKRLVGKQMFTDSSRLVFDLPRDFDYKTLMIRIYGTTTMTVAGTAVRAEAPLQLIKFISLKANGTDLLDGLSGIMAHRSGIVRRGQLAPLTPQAAATATAQAFAGFIILDREVIDGIRSKDGQFPSRGLSTFQLEVLMDVATAVLTGNPTGMITAGTCEVYAVQAAESAGADGKYSLPRVVTKRTQSTYPLTATNANYQIRLNTGALTRGLLLRSYGSVTAGEPSDAVVNNVKIVQGNSVLLDIPWAALRAMNVADLDVTTVPTGFAMVDFMNIGAPAGKLSDCLDMRNGAEVWLVLDVTGAANNAVDVATLEYVPFNAPYWGLK